MKKQATTSLISVSFLLFFSFPLAHSQGLLEPVLDIHGNDVVTGTPYYIRQVTVVHPPICGVIRGKTGNSTCPVSVACNSRVMFGTTVKFNIPEWANAIGKTVSEGIPLEIEFSDEIACASSSKWMVYGDSIETQKAVLGTGSPLNHAGQTTLFGYFSIIHKSKVGYSFLFCYLFQGSPLCSDVGTHLQKYPESLLVLTTSDDLMKSDPIFYFALEKADSDTSRVRRVAA